MPRLLVAGLLVVASAGAVIDAQTRDSANTLSLQEQKEGFELLFDGKSLDKFVVPPDQQKVWRVVNAVIRNEQAMPGATLLTNEDFGNFVLKS